MVDLMANNVKIKEGITKYPNLPIFFLCNFEGEWENGFYFYQSIHSYSVEELLYFHDEWRYDPDEFADFYIDLHWHDVNVYELTDNQCDEREEQLAEEANRIWEENAQDCLIFWTCNATPPKEIELNE